jgi:hypothetical protein
MQGICRKPKGSVYHVVVMEYIRYGDLVTATHFLESMKELIELHHQPIGLEISTIHELIRAWKNSDYIDRDSFIQQLQQEFLANTNGRPPVALR